MIDLRKGCRRQSGQASLEFALIWISVLVPVTFGIVYTSLLLWIWHSAADFTRRGAQYAITHCWQNGAGNVVSWMQQNAPPMWDRDQFTQGPAEIQVSYFSRDVDSGEYTTFACDSECSTTCVPDAVKVTVAGYQFRGFVTYLGLPPVPIPDFQTSMAMESAGCDPQTGTCEP